MTNEQQIVFINNLRRRLKSAVGKAQQTLANEHPELKNIFGILKTSAFNELALLDKELAKDIEDLTPHKFP